MCDLKKVFKYLFQHYTLLDGHIRKNLIFMSFNYDVFAIALFLFAYLDIWARNNANP